MNELIAGSGAADKGDSFAFMQDRFDEEFSRIEEAHKRVRRESIRRRATAYGLKALAALGGLVIALGVPQPISQYIGFAIAIAIALDQVSSNHSRLLSSVEAANAYDRMTKRVRRAHTLGLGPVMALKASGNLAQAKISATLLCENMLKSLHEQAEQIEEAQRRDDIRLLKKLALDDNQSPPPT